MPMQNDRALGRFDRCYWAAPDRLLAGSYPGDLEPNEAAEKLRYLLHCGVGLIVNLMEPTEVDSYGRRFVDYRPQLEALARDAGRTVRCERLPIGDMDVPSAARMRKILDTIDEANAREQVVYLHCWGGKGRTGTVVGCYLARHGIATGEAALQRLNELAGKAPFDLGKVPQTLAQCDFVKNWQEGQ